MWLPFFPKLSDYCQTTRHMPSMRNNSFHSGEAKARYLVVGSGLSLDQRAQRISAIRKESSDRNKTKRSSSMTQTAVSNPESNPSPDNSKEKSAAHPIHSNAQARQQAKPIPKATVLYHPSCQSAHDRHDLVSQYHYIYKLRAMKGSKFRVCYKQSKAISLKLPSSSPSSPSCSSSSWPRTS